MFKRQPLARIIVVAGTIGSMAGLSILSPATGLAASKPLAAAGSSAPAAHMINLTLPSPAAMHTANGCAALPG